MTARRIFIFAGLAAAAAGLLWLWRFSVSGVGGEGEAAVPADKALASVLELKEFEYFRYMVEAVPSAQGRAVVRPSSAAFPVPHARRYWFFEMGEDLGGFFEVWKQIAVDRRTGDVYLFDPYSGSLEPLAGWRARRYSN